VALPEKIWKFTFNAGGNHREEKIDLMMENIDELEEPNFVDWMTQEFAEIETK
jgi:hypothetical protein